MAVATQGDRLLSRFKITGYDLDPDATTATDTGWVTAKGLRSLVVKIQRTVGTGNLTSFKILGNTAADGTGTDVELKAHAVASEPNAAGDYLFLEVCGGEISSANESIVAVSGNVALGTGTDEMAVTYIAEYDRAYDGQTADYVS